MKKVSFGKKQALIYSYCKKIKKRKAKFPKIIDIVKELNMKKSIVYKTVYKLSELGLIDYEKRDYLKNNTTQ